MAVIQEFKYVLSLIVALLKNTMNYVTAKQQKSQPFQGWQLMCCIPQPHPSYEQSLCGRQRYHSSSPVLKKGVMSRRFMGVNLLKERNLSFINHLIRVRMSSTICHLAEIQTKIISFLSFIDYLINLLAWMRSSISNITQNICEVCKA